MDPEAAIYHCAGVACGPHLAGAGRVMTPGIVLDELANLLRAANIRSRENLLGDDALAARGDAAYGFHALRYRCEIVDRARAFVEIMKIDFRNVQRIGGAQRHAPSGVVGVSFQDGPAEEIVFPCNCGRITREVALERSEKAENEQVRFGPVWERSLHHRY